MILNKIMLHHPKNTWILAKIPEICLHLEKIPGILMTLKKYLLLKIFDPKNTTGPPVGLRLESPPWSETGLVQTGSQVGQI